LIDSQNVKTAKEAQAVGIDGGKKVKGHKRHSLTDTVGNMLNVVVPAANVSDSAGGELLIEKIQIVPPPIASRFYLTGNSALSLAPGKPQT